MELVSRVSILVVAGLQVSLLCVLINRKRFRDFPFFFAYVIFSIGTQLVRLGASSNYTTYFKVYWITEAVYAVLALLALHEIFREVFLAFYDVWWWFWLIFPAVTVVVLMLSIRYALLHPAAQAPQIIVVILSVGRVIRYLQAALFVLFFFLVWLLGIDWENYPFGIMLGFAISAAGAWLTYDLRSEFGTRFSTLFKYASPVAYICATLLWLMTFSRPQRQVVHEWAKNMTPEQMLEQVKQYVNALKKALGRDNDTE